MNWPLFLALTAAVTIPAAWGWLLYFIFTWLGLDRLLPAPVRAEPAEAPRNDDVWDYQI
jgi:hypothetical protein